MNPLDCRQLSTNDNAKSAIWPVMVLAHNEAKNITACLDSIYEADSGQRFSVFVMANGCTDNTEDVVREYAKKHENVNLVSIAIGDRCNAWNVFIHETIPVHAPDSGRYFFMDGDCRACSRAFSELAKGLEEKSQANAASAIPMTGFDQEKDAREILEQHGLVANLYALSGRFVRRLQAKNVRLPLGLDAGDDGLIGALAKWDLDTRGEWNDDLIVPCANAGFTFEPISPMDFRAWKKFWRRLVLYSRRHYDNQLLGPRLKKEGIAGMPERISDLYADYKNLNLYWNGIYTISSLIALKQVQKHAKLAATRGSA